MFCTSQRINRFLEENGIPQDATVVPGTIKTAPPTATGKLEKIAAMPRKRAFKLDVIKKYFATSP